ncbi:MAG: DNA recombination protein RmuC [Candidatus Aminicenantes bacterium]|nr:DNA recombination protein RmuC [Candidatus Aminicenantes bacterium]
MSTSVLLIILGSVLLLFFLFLLWFMRTTAAKIEEIKKLQAQDKALSLMQQQIGQLTQNINQQLQNMSTQFQKTTGHIGGTLGDVKKDLGKMEEVTREVLEKAKNISNLENLLRAPKFRGGFGELFLGDLLAQILPPVYFDLQYKFKSGEMIDAVIHIGDNLVPIDAKFPLENFQKYMGEEDKKKKEDLRKKFVTDVKKHISEIALKYILPDEGTYDFALMYIPAENIYYETILKDESLGEERSIFSFALKKKVIPVSPNSFFAYLQVIVLGLKGLQIEKSAREIFQRLNRLQGDLTRFRKDFQVLGTHLVHAGTKFDDAERRLDRFSDKLELVSGDQVEKLIEKAEEMDDSEDVEDSTEKEDLD